MKLQPLAKGTILYQSIWYLAWAITLGGYQPGQSWFGSDERSRRHVGPAYTGTVTFLNCIFIFFNRATAHTREPILAHNSSKDAIWCKEDPFRMRNVKFWNLGVFNPKTPIKLVGIGNYQPKWNFEYLWNGKRYAKCVNEPWLWNRGRSFRIRQENSPEAPPSEEITMTSYPTCNKTSLDKTLLRNAVRK